MANVDVVIIKTAAGFNACVMLYVNARAKAKVAEPRSPPAVTEWARMRPPWPPRPRTSCRGT